MFYFEYFLMTHTKSTVVPEMNVIFAISHEFTKITSATQCKLLMEIAIFPESVVE